MANSFLMKSMLMMLIVVSGSTIIAAWASDSPPTNLREMFRRPADIPFPATNPYTPEKSALGKALFFDPRLSGNQNMTCATCHNPSLAGRFRSRHRSARRTLPWPARHRPC